MIKIKSPSNSYIDQVSTAIYILLMVQNNKSDVCNLVIKGSEASYFPIYFPYKYHSFNSPLLFLF
jgi:hypothetical protein